MPSAPAAIPEPRSVEPKPTETRVKFTALLELATAGRFERLTADMRSVGRLAAGRYPSRADLLRAVLALMEADPDLRVLTARGGLGRRRGARWRRGRPARR